MSTRPEQKQIVLCDEDAFILQRLVVTSDQSMSQYSESLKKELRRAVVVPKASIPADVIIMGSTVKVRDLTERDRQIFTIVFPWDADSDRNRISVFAPIGTALLGYRTGDKVDWEAPAGVCSLKVEEVHQPACRFSGACTLHCRTCGRAPTASPPLRNRS
jgi:regulator of nucleoside diphosphate kinase